MRDHIIPANEGFGSQTIKVPEAADVNPENFQRSLSETWRLTGKNPELRARICADLIKVVENAVYDRTNPLAEPDKNHGMHGETTRESLCTLVTEYGDEEYVQKLFAMAIKKNHRLASVESCVLLVKNIEAHVSSIRQNPSYKKNFKQKTDNCLVAMGRIFDATSCVQAEFIKRRIQPVNALTSPEFRKKLSVEAQIACNKAYGFNSSVVEPTANPEGPVRTDANHAVQSYHHNTIQ